MFNSDPSVIGIDVAQGKLDLSPADQIGFASVTNDQKGMDRLIPRLLKIRPALVVLEATGGYERLLARTLHAAGLPVHIANPSRVRYFANALGILAKTDKVDAGAIELYGRRIQPQPMAAPDPATEEIADLQARYRQLVDMRTAETNRLAIAPPSLQPGIQEHLHWLKEQIKQVEQEIARKIKEAPQLAAVARILRSVPGVGPATTAVLTAHLPELGRITAKQISSLAGVAPFARDSGRKQGKRRIGGGRAPVRSALYMAVLTTIRLTPSFKSYYERLLAAGKTKKVALVACIRKLLVTLNSMVKANSTWNPGAVRP